MKRTIILPLLLVLSSCTTVRRDDHSYTYIHNFNNNGSNSESPVSIKRPKIRKDADSEDDAPFYNKGLSSNNDIIGDQQFVQGNGLQPSTVHNHYYAEQRPHYQIPPAYSGRYEAYNPAGRRFLLRAELLNSN
jgi:hypothetical protein